MSFGPITFTGTAGDTLTTYDSNWQRLSSDTGTILISSAGTRARRGTISTAAQYTYAGWTPASADYDVEADFVVMNTTTTERFGIIGRADPASRTFYLARFTAGSTTATISLMKANGASPTIISSVTKTVAINDVLKIRLSMSGSTIKVFINDVEEISTTDTSITAAGRMGLYYSSDTTTPGGSIGVHIDNMSGLESLAGRTADFSATLGAATLSSGTTETVVADLSKTLGAVTLSSTIPQDGRTADLSVTLGANTSSSSVLLTDTVNSSITLGAMSLMANIGQGGIIDFDKTLGGITVSSSVSDPVVVNASVTLGAVTLSSTIPTNPERIADFSKALGAMVSTGDTTSIVVASVSKTLGSMLSSSLVKVGTVVDLSKQLGGTTVVATAGFVPDRQADLSLTLGAITVTSTLIPRPQPTPVSKRTLRINDFRR